jgi:ParB family chromosome partitioning protein
VNAKPKVTLSNTYLDMFKSTDPDKAKKEPASTMPLSALISFGAHPFRLYTGEKQNEMVKSIRQNGVLVPLLVRPAGDGSYQIVAGHNRAECAKLAGLSDVPVIIREMDDDEAVIVMVESNLCQRESILPSERAFAFKLKLEAMNRQGERTCGTQFHKLKSRDSIGESSDMTGRQVSKYIRLTSLIPELLDMVDTGKLALICGADLSYLSDTRQMLVLELAQDKAYKLTGPACGKLKDQEKAGALNDDNIREILLARPKQPKRDVKIPYKAISKYNIPQNRVQEVIVKALDLFFSGQKKEA